MSQNTITSGIKPKHINSSDCPKCEEIFNKYKGFHAGLKNWFKSFQNSHNDAHISCAGRGRILQEYYFHSGQSRAHYGQSAHNYNAAIDLFRLTHTGLSYDANWFKVVVSDAIGTFNKTEAGFKINWYGLPGTKFFELPHCEVANWKTLTLSLVEPTA